MMPGVGNVFVADWKPVPPDPGPFIICSPPTIVCNPADTLNTAEGELEIIGDWK